MKKFDNYTYCGIFLNLLWLISNRFNLLPDFIEGLFVGLGLTFILIGIYKLQNYVSQLRDYKKKLLNHLLEK